MIINSFRFASAVAPSFTLEVNATDGTFTIPTTTGTYLYDYTTNDTVSGTGITGNTTITFPSGIGTYEIYITGTFPRIYFNNGGEKLKLLRVLEWGDYGVGATNQTSAFYGCTNLTSIANDVDNINLVTNGTFMFNVCSSLATLPSNLTLDSLTSATNMFRFCPLTDLPNGMTLPNLSVGTNMFALGAVINTTRYSQLLVDLESGNANNGVRFHAGTSKYNATGETARNILTGAVRLWTITDGGLEV